MPAESTQISRRTIAKGAAWATPVVAMGARLPQAAASAHGCPVGDCWKITGAAPTYTTALAGTIADDGSSADSLVTLHLGWWALNGPQCTVSKALYYRVHITGVVGYDMSNVAHAASDLAGATLQYGDTAGGQWGPSMQFKGFMAYPGANQWTATHRLQRFVISYEYTLLDAAFKPLTAENQPCAIVLDATCGNTGDCGDGTLFYQR